MGCTVVLHALDRQLPAASRAVLVNGPIKLEVTDDFSHALAVGAVGELLDEMVREWPNGEREFAAAYLHEPTDEVVDWLTSIARQTPLDIAVAAIRGQAELDQRAAVGRVRVPLLAAYGSLDKHWHPGLPRYIADHAPNGHLVLFERSAHCPPLEETDAFCAVLGRFIETDSA
jgi:pimeloyl-ACP methyl ester carboxylesterase